VNVYEFIKKAYGEGDLSGLGVYLIQPKSSGFHYKVVGLTSEHLYLVYGEDRTTSLSSTTAFYVDSTYKERKTFGSNTLLHVLMR
jgi:hypothetical protein